MSVSLAERIAALGFSGVAQIRRGDDVLFECVRGLADRAHGTPNRASTRFGLASFTKMFTAVTAVTLLEDVHQPVVELVEPERRPATLRADVTPHHLLCHTSGIADYFEEEETDDYEGLWAVRPAYAMRRPLDFLPLYGDRDPYRPPGERYQYSNAGYVLLGELIEALSGSSYIEAVGAAVFAPAGMDRSGFLALDEVHEDVATGYLEDGRTNVFAIPVVGGGDGGAFACARDIDRFFRAYDTLVDPAVMRAPHATVEPGLAMGYGVFVSADGRWGHGGGDPGVGVLAAHHPSGVSTIVLSNVPGQTVAVRDLLIDSLA